MVVLIAVIVLLVPMLPTAIWFAVKARRAERLRADTEHRPLEPRYSLDEPGRGPNQLGSAWARTTTYLD